ncbi:MAG: C40 family peptidase [Burkholderiales bacterium]
MVNEKIAAIEEPRPAPAESINWATELLMHALSLMGSPYRFGGSSPHSGFDCSGYVGYVFREALNIVLPRSALAISRIGEKITLEELRPGDLVFYNTLHRAFSHVGIYLGDRRFIHAPSRGGNIEISDMAESYWLERFNGARRLLPAMPGE